MSRNYKFHNPQVVYFVSFAEVEWMDVSQQMKGIDENNMILKMNRF